MIIITNGLNRIDGVIVIKAYQQFQWSSEQYPSWRVSEVVHSHRYQTDNVHQQEQVPWLVAHLIMCWYLNKTNSKIQ